MNDVSKNVEGLGLRIAQCRTKLELSQNNISNLIGMPRPNYTAIENEVSGRFLKDYQLKAIAIKLNVSSDYLLGLISDPTPNADTMSIVNSLGLSGDTISFIKSLKSSDSKNLLMLDNFIKSFDSDFLELLSLYKRVKSFFNTEYSFVLKFTEDINPVRVNFYNGTFDDFPDFEPYHKYFYYNLDDSKKYFEIRAKIFNDPNNNSINEVFDKLMALLHTGEYTENYIHLYQEKSKLEEFKSALKNVKVILHDLIMLLDFDETGIVFSTSDKEVEICKYIDQLIALINKSSTQDIDNILENLYSCLLFFNKTISYSLNFIKYRISNTFNDYLEKDLK